MTLAFIVHLYIYIYVVRDFFFLSKQSDGLLCEIRQDVTLLFLWHKSVKDNNTGQLHYYTAAGHDVLLSRINYLTPCCTISKSECFTVQEDRQGAETMYSIWSEYYKRGTSRLYDSGRYWHFLLALSYYVPCLRMTTNQCDTSIRGKQEELEAEVVNDG